MFVSVLPHSNGQTPPPQPYQSHLLPCICYRKHGHVAGHREPGCSANTLTNYTYVSTLQILYSFSKSIFHTAGGRSQCTVNNASNLSALPSAVPGRARSSTRSGVSYSSSRLLLQALRGSRELEVTSGPTHPVHSIYFIKSNGVK